MNDANNPYDVLIDKALDSYPLAPLPPEFVGLVMARVRESSGEPHHFRFQLKFLDLALALFLALFVSAVLALFLWISGTLDIGWPPPLDPDLGLRRLLTLPVLGWVVVGALLFLAEVALILWVSVQLWLDKPYSLAQHG